MIDIREIEERIFGRSAGDEMCFWTRASRGYDNGIARMSVLAADDPFWEGTNAQATEAKLWGYCQVLLERDPRDTRALWSLIGLDTRCCSNALEDRCWRPLLDLGDFHPHWLVEHACWVWANSGKDTVPLIADLLRRHQLVEVTRSAVLALRGMDQYGDEWVERVVAMTA